jgi:hypothetical protein
MPYECPKEGCLNHKPTGRHCVGLVTVEHLVVPMPAGIFRGGRFLFRRIYERQRRDAMSITHGTVARRSGGRRLATLFLAGAAALAGMAAAPSTALADRKDDRDFGRFRDGRVDFRYDERDHGRRVWVEPVYRTVVDRVWIEPVYRIEVDRVYREPVVQTVCEKVWCPDRYELRNVDRYEYGRRVVRRERVLVERGHYKEVHRQVVVKPGCWENVERRVLVCEGHYKTVERREVVRPGHWQTVAHGHGRGHHGRDDRWNIGVSLKF